MFVGGPHNGLGRAQRAKRYWANHPRGSAGISRGRAFWLVVLAALVITGCRRNVEVEKVLQVVDVHTGWYDAGIVEGGKNKLVPSTSLRLQNVSKEPISSVQLNAIFRRLGDQAAWGEHYVKAIGQEDLAPGGKTREIVLRSNLGYTGTQSRLQLLQNREFVDAKVEIYGKHGPRTWAKLGEYQIDRQLLTQ